jgi:hypothetical protein
MPDKPFTNIMQGIPTADQEALQEPAIDPIKAATLGLSGGAGMVMQPGGVDSAIMSLGKYAVNGLFSYILHQALFNQVNKVRNTPIDKPKGTT